MQSVLAWFDCLYRHDFAVHTSPNHMCQQPSIGTELAPLMLGALHYLHAKYHNYTLQPSWVYVLVYSRVPLVM